ncbi:MAG: GxxExxY protein [Calditrichaeota bacterium]|nr:GxxExxY protein [Calditrichota bacterium]
MAELIFRDEVYQIIGAAMEVHKILGPGFLEAVYQEALEIEFTLRGIPYQSQPKLPLEFKRHPLKTFYVPDFLCFDEIIVEIKAMKKCGEREEAQIINANKTARKRLGVLINFGELSLYWKRYIN